MTDIALAKRLYSFIDLTSLNPTDNNATITALCGQANTFLGSVAAVCIYPQFISLVKALLNNSPIKIATVCNFPDGTASLPATLIEIKTAIAAGANEIDVVIPYREYLLGKQTQVKDFIYACKEICGPQILLKAILETGALQKNELIANASRDVILAGADFIKTSTGKIAIGATLEAAEIMLTTIRDLKLNRSVGFKAAGGIRQISQAVDYINLAETIMGSDWISPQTFRIGASSLVNELLHSP